MQRNRLLRLLFPRRLLRLDSKKKPKKKLQLQRRSLRQQTLVMSNGLRTCQVNTSLKRKHNRRFNYLLSKKLKKMAMRKRNRKKSLKRKKNPTRKIRMEMMMTMMMRTTQTMKRKLKPSLRTLKRSTARNERLPNNCSIPVCYFKTAIPNINYLRKYLSRKSKWKNKFTFLSKINFNRIIDKMYDVQI